MDYLNAKKINFNNPKDLFDKLTVKILNNKKTDKNLKQDLPPLFLDQAYINNWINNWRDSYLYLLKEYKFSSVKDLKKIEVIQDFSTGIYSFVYFYNSKESTLIRIIFNISEYWIDFKEGNLSIEISKNVKDHFDFKTRVITNRPSSKKKLMQYAELFLRKTEKYFKKSNNIIMNNTISTKVIRMTSDNLKLEKEILLNKETLIKCELEDLLP